MSAFSAAIETMFRDRNLSVAATYRAGGAGLGVEVRVMRRAADDVMRFAGSGMVTDSVVLDVRVAEAPGLAAGDTFEIDGEVFVARGEPLRDRERLIWQVEVSL